MRRVSQNGRAASRVAQALGMSEALLGRWIRAAWAQTARPAGSEALEQENKQLRAQVTRVELTEYLDHYHHTRRLHSALGYCTPLEIELHHRFSLP